MNEGKKTVFNDADVFATGGEGQAPVPTENPVISYNDHSADVFSTGGGIAPQQRSLGFIGRYQIIRKLGQGGMGSVFLVQDHDGRHFALKTLSPQFKGDSMSVKNFQQEFFTQASFDHPHIVKVYDYGEDSETGIPYYTMEYLDGVTLEQRIGEEKIPLLQLQGIISQLCEVMIYVHSMGVVHRDLKPANIMIDNGQVKVFDFGIAKMEQGTLHTAFVGSAYYMAPEQLYGSEVVSPAADVFSLGVISYQLLTGVPPTGVVSPPSAWERYGISEAIDSVVMRAMHQISKKRYQTIEEFYRDFSSAFGIKPFTKVFFTWKPEPENTEHQVLHGPVYSDKEKAFFFINNEKKVVAVDVTTGKVKWVVDSKNEVKFIGIDHRKKRLVLNEAFHHLSDGTKTLEEHFDLLRMHSILMFRAVVPDKSSPVLWQKSEVRWPAQAKELITGDKVFYNEGNYLVAANKSNGHEEWRFKANYQIQPQLVNENLILITLDGKIYSLNAEDGSINWQRQYRFPTTKQVGVTSTMIHFGDADGTIIRSLDISNGEELFSFESPAKPASQLTEDAGKLFFADKAGTVYGLC